MGKTGLVVLVVRVVVVQGGVTRGTHTILLEPLVQLILVVVAVVALGLTHMMLRPMVETVALV
jgi:hypothetical protein